MAKRAKQQAATKLRSSARFDVDVVERYKELAAGGSYQALMNQALREWLDREELRKVVREEMREVVREELRRSA